MNFNKISQIIFVLIFLSIHHTYANQTQIKTLPFTKNPTLTIISPENDTTISGKNVSIRGSSSHFDCTLRLFLNNKIVAIKTTAEDGSWSINPLNLPNGNYTVKVEIYGLTDDNFCKLCSATSNFNVINDPTISITSPLENNINLILSSNISGYTSEPSASIEISIDGFVIDTVEANATGYWETDFPALENGEHELHVELLSGPSTLVTKTITFISSSPTYIYNNMQLHLIDGNIPTTGSGTGNGFSYNVEGSTATITFTQPFSSIPTMITTGQYSLGSSTVTVSYLDTSSCSLTFSAGTERIHFSARELL